MAVVGELRVSMPACSSANRSRARSAVRTCLTLTGRSMPTFPVRRAVGRRSVRCRQTRCSAFAIRLLTDWSWTPTWRNTRATGPTGVIANPCLCTSSRVANDDFDGTARYRLKQDREGTFTSGYSRREQRARVNNEPLHRAARRASCTARTPSSTASSSPAPFSSWVSRSAATPR
jgi:hypothetical protein